jgi:AhpD family alkylhydroperoxidase
MTHDRGAALGSALPEAYRHLLAMHRTVQKAAGEAGLDPRLIELVKIRASQVNGCAFCTDMHSRDALELGEDQRRLLVLPVWAETELFDERERAALALAESMTDLPAHREVPDDVYDQAATVFTESQLTAVVWTITVINAFNRFGVTGRMPLPDVA